MGRTILVSIIIALVLFLGISANAVEKATDREDLSDYIAACEQFGAYNEVAEALLCAASIPYGASPEDCVEELQGKGFHFEYEIYSTLPNDALGLDATYSDDGTPQLPMMREVALRFSTAVALYLRTESTMIDLASADEEFAAAGVSVTEDMELWKPDEELPKGKIVAAHLQFFDENTQEWITWTFMSPEGYKAE